MLLPPGTRLAQYEIAATLGSGGMGDVYRARDLRLARDVAVKVMAERIAADPSMRQRFETEARAVAALSHPCIMSIYELGAAEGRLFAVMELLEGQTLRARLAKGAVGWRESVTIGAAIADGLAAAHVKGVIHRDLKPENVFLTAAGTVKILDFGLALNRIDGLEQTGIAGVTRTAPGVVLGTFGYMSPEQITGGPVDGRSDIFAAGCVLYEMLAGRRLFTGETPQEIVAGVLHDTLPDLSALDPAAPAELRAIVSRCIARDPARRFAAAADLEMALRALLTTSTERTTAKRPRARGKSLAILPFVNSGGDAQIEYLTDGITESIINSLSQLPGLRVVPRSLVFRYKGLQADPSTVGLALNARTILTGHVVQQGDSLSIQAELVDTATESQLWGERFRQKTEDLLLLQEEIAWQISEALRLKLTGAQKKTLRKRVTVNPEAYQEYLRGRHQWHNWSHESFRRAIEHFERALSHDPGYALAYAGLGNAFGAMSYYGLMAPEDGFPRARAAALRALEIDDRLADAHVTIALERLFYGWDWPAVDAALARALALDPNSALAHEVHSIYLMTCGRFDEALEAAKRARALDPLSPFINMGVAWVHHFAGRPADAARECLDVLAMKPGLEEAGNILIAAYESLDRLEEAAALIGKQRCWGMYLDSASLQQAFQRGGREGYLRDRLAQMQRQEPGPPSASFAFAHAHVRLGEFEQAIEHLERMVEHRAGGSVFIGIDAALSPLRGNPRYDALIKRIGAPLPQMV
jgi:serine/threonine protein kinase